MIAILLKDLLLTWVTFRRYILVAVVLLVVGTVGLVLYGEAQPVGEASTPEGWRKLGVVTDDVPVPLLDRLRASDAISLQDYADVESLKTAVSEKRVRYGLYSDRPGTLTLGVAGSGAINSLIRLNLVDVYFKELTGPIQFVDVSQHQPETYQSYMLWFAFISLLMIGNSLCNILVWEERAKGNLEELVASPVTRLEILLGKLSSVLLSTVGLCLGVVVAVIAAVVLAATIIIVNSSALLSSFLGSSPDTSHAADQANAVDVAGILVNWADPTLVGVIALSVFFALLTLTTALVVVNFWVKQQATLRFVITPALLAVYGLPFVTELDVISSSDWYWMPPIVNVYFTSVFTSVNDVGATAWLPCLGVNVLTFVVSLFLGVVVISRIQDWPSR